MSGNGVCNYRDKSCNISNSDMQLHVHDADNVRFQGKWNNFHENCSRCILENRLTLPCINHMQVLGSHSKLANDTFLGITSRVLRVLLTITLISNESLLVNTESALKSEAGYNQN